MFYDAEFWLFLTVLKVFDRMSDYIAPLRSLRGSENVTIVPIP
jgi:hypothetical protein